MKVNCCWIYAISKYGYPPSLENTFRVVKEMADLGFKYIELEGVRKDNLLEVYNHRAELKNHCDNLGLKVVNFCPILPDIVSLDEAKRREALELFDLGIETARYFGCETVQSDSYTPPLEFVGESPYKQAIDYGKRFNVRIDPAFRWNDVWDSLVDSIKTCSAHARQAGLGLIMEPRVGEIISNTDAIMRLMDAVGDDNFGAVLDTAHQHAQKEILPLSVEKLGSRIKYLHVADNNAKENEHLALGRGTVDWDGVFMALQKHKFDGFVAIDVGRVPDLDQQYLESKQFLEVMAEKYSL